MERVLVTGSSGFVGGYIVDSLKNSGYSVLGVDKLSKMGYTDVVMDLSDPDVVTKLKSMVCDCSAIIHSAAICDLKGDSSEYYYVNVKINRNIEILKYHLKGGQKLIFLSSMLADPNEYNGAVNRAVKFYGESKYKCEQELLAGNTDGLIILRPTSVWGYGSSNYDEFFLRVRQGLFRLTDWSYPKKPFVYVENLTKIILWLLEKEARSKILVACDYHLSVEDLYLAYIANVKVRFAHIKINKNFILIAAKIGDMVKDIGINFPITTFRLQNMLKERIVDNNWIAENDISLLPLEECMKEYSEYEKRSK